MAPSSKNATDFLRAHYLCASDRANAVMTELPTSLNVAYHCNHHHTHDIILQLWAVHTPFPPKPNPSLPNSSHPIPPKPTTHSPPPNTTLAQRRVRTP